MKKRITFFTFLIVSMFQTVQAQSALGDMACVYIQTHNLDSSAEVYSKLGFAETGSNTFPVPWKQLSDGSLVIMLRQDEQAYMGLTYYSNNVDAIAQKLQADGIVFTRTPATGDAIKRYYFSSPDGFHIMLADNLGGFKAPQGITLLNMNQADFNKPEKFPNPDCGVFGEYCHPVADLNASLPFWKKIGFTVKYQVNEPYPHAILSDGLMIIGLHQTSNFNYPAITYFGLNTLKRIEHLKSKGLVDFSALMGAANQVLKTWEGAHVFIFSLGM